MTGKRLLIVAHAPSPNTERLRDALIAGARSPNIEGVEVTALGPFATTPAEVLSADAIILGATENLDYMSGALKDFFARCYCPCLGRTEGKPYAFYIRAGNDGTGAKRGVETIVTGLRWRKIQEPLIFRGAWREEFVARVPGVGNTDGRGSRRRRVLKDARIRQAPAERMRKRRAQRFVSPPPRQFRLAKNARPSQIGPAPSGVCRID